VKKLADHGRGTALLHARTEAEWFEPVWQTASAILFLADRLYFHYPDGRRAEANSGAPACLIAFGKFDATALKQSNIPGYLVSVWECQNSEMKPSWAAACGEREASHGEGVREGQR
jgi:hypothetical protein